MSSHDDEEGGIPEGRDLDLDLEKDALLSDSEWADGQHVLPNGRGAALAAADAEPFLGSPRDLHHGGRSTPATTDTVHPSLGKTVRKGKRSDAVGWADLPRKKQLVVITLARLSEPLVQTSLQVCRPALNHLLSPLN